MNYRDIEKQHDLDFRDVFAKTGHETLRALLIVSGGAAIAYLSFLGISLGDQARFEEFGLEALNNLILAMREYISSVTAAVLCYGCSYFAHGAYYFSDKGIEFGGFDKTSVRRSLMWIANGAAFVCCISGFACLWFFVKGSWIAGAAFTSAAENMAR